MRLVPKLGQMLDGKEAGTCALRHLVKVPCAEAVAAEPSPPVQLGAQPAVPEAVPGQKDSPPPEAKWADREATVTQPSH